MNKLATLKAVINELKCIYTLVPTSNLIDSLITVRDNLLATHHVITKKAELAKQLLTCHKCVMVDDVYIIVPITEDGHRFGRLDINQNVLYYHHPVPGRDDCSVKLCSVPYGPSELLAWTAAYDKLKCKKK